MTTSMTAETKSIEHNPDSPLELIKTVAIALLIALLLRIFVFQPFNIPSESMRPKLLVGDYVIVSKWDYGFSFASIPFEPRIWQGRVPAGIPERGDVVVFKFPHAVQADPMRGIRAAPADKVDYIKRVVGLPGDRIQVVGGQLVINGTPVARELLGPHIITDADGNTISINRYRETLPNGKTYITYDYAPDAQWDNTDVYVVPEGHLFMMGDNRDNSTDSRVPPISGGVGYVPVENVVGRARTVLLSWDQTTSVFLPWTWFTGLRYDRIAVPVR